MILITAAALGVGLMAACLTVLVNPFLAIILAPIAGSAAALLASFWLAWGARVDAHQAADRSDGRPSQRPRTERSSRAGPLSYSCSEGG